MASSSEKSSTGPKPHSNVWGYLDETGTLKGNRGGKVFGLGIIITPNPRLLHKRVCDLRSSQNFGKEFHFNDVNEVNLPVYKKLIDIYVLSENVRFSADIYLRKNIHTGGLDTAAINELYNKLSSKVIGRAMDKGSGKKSEYIAVIADDLSTSVDDTFEREIKNRLRMFLRRNAVFGVSRAESHAFSELQLADVLLGCVAYGFKLDRTLLDSRPKAAKVQLVKHLQKQVNSDELSTSFVSNLKFGQRFEVKDKTSIVI